MRVISGAFKGRRLHTPKGDWLRPTSDRTREFIFSYLGNYVPNSVVLDLFAGTGSLGIESLSRGATQATFVDISYQSILIIKKNLELVQQKAEVHKREAIAFVQETRFKYDLIFADPPYRYSEGAGLLHTVRSQQILNAQGLCIFETSSRQPLPVVAGFRLLKEKNLGDTAIYFYEIAYES
jgi:16S rRNA (guanine966-N2)-methyltransferase